MGGTFSLLKGPSNWTCDLRAAHSPVSGCTRHLLAWHEGDAGPRPSRQAMELFKSRLTGGMQIAVQTVGSVAAAASNKAMAISAVPRPLSKHLLLLYLVVVILLCYLGLDFTAGPGCNKQQEQRLVGGAERGVAASDPESVCSTLDGHYDVTLTSWDRSGGDPWRQLKWVGEPAFCRVRGQLIEKMDAENNFRRGFALRHTQEVEDRTHILPWLMGSRVDLNARPRRVYLDLGANSFRSSVRWFATMYPCDFTEVHAFEKELTLFQMPSQGFDEEGNWRHDHITDAVRVKETPEFPRWMLDRITLYNKFVGDVDDEASGAINITRFVKEELKLRANDTVVVKMDIESAEWPILRRWMEDPEMVAIVDELFVEIHYADSSMNNFGWNDFRPMTREQAKRLLAELRWRGLFAHFWP